MSINKRLFFLMFFVCVTSDSFSITIGSNFFVSRENFSVFRQKDTDNIIKGFATFNEGFRLEDNTTTCTFDAYYPVGGQVNLCGGKLILIRDLNFDVSIRLLAPGYIVGNGNSIQFPQASANLFLSELDNEQIKNLQNSDSYNMAGFVNGVDWSYDGDYVTGVTDYQTGKEIQVFSFNGTNLSLVDDYESTQDVYKVRWHPSLFYFATVGTNGSGEGLALYQFTDPTLAQTNLQDLSGDGYAVAWHGSGDYLATGSDWATGELKMWDFDSGLGTATIKQTVGLDVNRRITALSFAPGGNYLAVGTLASGSEATLLVYAFDGSNLTLDSSIDTQAPVRALDWSPTGTYIAVGMSSGLERLRVYKHDAALSSVTAVALSQVGEGFSVLGTHWSRDGDFLLYSTGTDIGASKGVCYFNKSAEELLIVSLGSWLGAINDIRWSPNNNYIAYGDVGTFLNVDQVLDGWALEFNNTNMVFKSPVNINSVWKLSGNCIINGGGYDFNFTDLGRIELAAGAQVTFKDVILKNVKTENFFCLTDNASITFDNSALNIARDYTFTNGSLFFQNDVTLAGTNKFIYSSRVSSTIDSGSTLYLESGMTFSYDPVINNKDLLYFVDNSSKLHLNLATLHAAKYGMRLRNGTMVIEGLCEFSAEPSSNPLYTVEFGDQNIAHDFTMKILAGSEVELADGYFAYRNINSEVWRMPSSTSFMCVEGGATLHLYETLDLGNGRLLKYNDGSTLIRESGSVKILGAVSYTSVH